MDSCINGNAGPNSVSASGSGSGSASGSVYGAGSTSVSSSTSSSTSESALYRKSFIKYPLNSADSTCPECEEDRRELASRTVANPGKLFWAHSQRGICPVFQWVGDPD